MRRAYAPSIYCPAMARTYGRNGRTQNLLTSQRNSPFVTRGRTYGEVWS